MPPPSPSPSPPRALPPLDSSCLGLTESLLCARRRPRGLGESLPSVLARALEGEALVGERLLPRVGEAEEREGDTEERAGE